MEVVVVDLGVVRIEVIGKKRGRVIDYFDVEEFIF